jgi:plasmid stability protein
MDTQKRATVYFESDVHRALRLKAAALDRTVSDMVNEAVKAALAEDAEDLAAFSERKSDKSHSFDTFVQGLKRRGRI